MLTYENIPITLYIHLPWCLKKCPYCDFNSFDSLKIHKDAYIERLIQQAYSFRSALEGRSLAAIFIGGGTPNLFTLNQLDYLLTHIFKLYPTHKDLEVSIEANPGINHRDFKFYPDIGINRLSLGIQSFQTTYLQALKRIYNITTLLNAIDIIQGSAFQDFNIDLMFGLPNQTLEDGLLDLQQAIQCGITHLSWYELTLEPNTSFAKQKITLPSENTIELMQTQGRMLLQKNNWKQYEITAYSQPNHPCQHNLNYWQFGDYIGLGAGAHSKITQFARQEITRLENHSDVSSYCQKFIKTKQVLTREQIALEFMMNALRLHLPFSLQTFINRTGLSITFIQSFLNTAKEQNFIKINNQLVSTTTKGKTFINQLLKLASFG